MVFNFQSFEGDCLCTTCPIHLIFFKINFTWLPRTQSAIVRVVNDILLNAESDKDTVLSLTLVQLFDTVDQSIFIDRLRWWVCITAISFPFFLLYVDKRTTVCGWVCLWTVLSYIWSAARLNPPNDFFLCMCISGSLNDEATWHILLNRS